MTRTASDVAGSEHQQLAEKALSLSEEDRVKFSADTMDDYVLGNVTNIRHLDESDGREVWIIYVAEQTGEEYDITIQDLKDGKGYTSSVATVDVSGPVYGILTELTTL